MKIVLRILKRPLDKHNTSFVAILVDLNLLKNIDIEKEDIFLLDILDQYSQPFIREYNEMVLETDLNISALIEKIAQNTKSLLEFTVDEPFEFDSRIKQVIIKAKKENNAALIMKTIFHQQYTIGFKPGIFAEKPSLNN